MEHHENRKSNVLFLVAIIAVGALFVFAFAQTIQVNALKTDMKQLQVASPAPKVAAGQQAPVARAPVQQPAMVGGC